MHTEAKYMSDPTATRVQESLMCFLSELNKAAQVILLRRVEEDPDTSLPVKFSNLVK